MHVRAIFQRSFRTSDEKLLDSCFEPNTGFRLRTVPRGFPKSPRPSEKLPFSDHSHRPANKNNHVFALAFGVRSVIAFYSFRIPRAGGRRGRKREKGFFPRFFRLPPFTFQVRARLLRGHSRRRTFRKTMATIISRIVRAAAAKGLRGLVVTRAGRPSVIVVIHYFGFLHARPSHHAAVVLFSDNYTATGHMSGKPASREVHGLRPKRPTLCNVSTNRANRREQPNSTTTTTTATTTRTARKTVSRSAESENDTEIDKSHFRLNSKPRRTF